MSVNILIPTIDVAKANKYAELMYYRANYPCEIYVVEDVNKLGWVATINNMARALPADFYVYAADDAYPSRGFLKTAMDTIQRTGAGLLGFNEGKYQELNAGFGLVRHSWIKDIYGGDILYSGYRSHFSEPELTLIAKYQKKFVYEPRASLVEVVFDKDGANVKPNNKKDHDLFFKRLETGFDDKIRPMIRTLID